MKAMDQIAGKITLGGKQYQLRHATIAEIEDKLGDIRRDLQAEAKRLGELEGAVEEIKVALEVVMGAAGFESAADAKSDEAAVIVAAATPAAHRHAAAPQRHPVKRSRPVLRKPTRHRSRRA